MNLSNTLKLLNVGVKAEGGTAGQMGPADSRSADDWIKSWLDEKADKQNKMRQQLLRTVDAKPLSAAYEEGKYVDEQDISKIAEGGRWAVMSPDGLILSTHHERDDAVRASDAKRYAAVVDLGPEYEYRRRGPLGKRKTPAVSLADALLSRDQPRTLNGRPLQR